MSDTISGTPIPTVMTAAGLQPQTPTELNATIIVNATALSPGYTANLPGSLVEDISSTDTGALIIMDQARVDLINSVSPLSANPFILYQLGAQAGVAQGQGINTSVYVVFSSATIGYVIPPGFTVSDGANQYIIQDGGVIQTGGTSAQLYALAANSGAFAVPANTVTTLITSVPSTVTLTVTNPVPGTPATTVETISDYRGRVVQAQGVACQGTPTFVKTLLGNVPGVQSRLISVTPSLQVIVGGGGDPYAIAYAIYQGVGNVSLLTTSTLYATSITAANPGVVITSNTHGFSTGQVVTISGAVPSGYNGTFTITVLSVTEFSIGVSTASLGAYTTEGVVTPNLRNQTPSIYDYPDTYTVPFIVPLVDIVTISLIWNTNSLTYVSATAVATLGNTALVNYINSIAAGQPINLFELQNAFQNGVATVVNPTLITRMVFSVTINNVAVSPVSGTGIINGDPLSYFFTNSSEITINQG